MMARLQERVQNFPRLWGWMALSVALLCIVLYVSPQQFPVILYKLSMVTVSAVGAYWIDRSLFKQSGQARFADDMPRDLYSSARLVSRALIYVGTVLGITLGL